MTQTFPTPRYPGTVSLVGAGPGDPDLLTLKGLKALQQADVVAYDRLANPALLEHCRPEAERILVGKCPYQGPAWSQEAINALLVARARRGQRVVRLKGGDPFIFGRGGEEALALRQAGIAVEVVPGISSAVAAPAYAGIPVTHRGVAASVAVVTGHEDPTKGGSSLNWPALATAVDTLVILMGVRRLPDLAADLIRYGRPAHTPAAAVYRGTTPDQQTVVATLETLPCALAAAGLRSPVAIIVGDVVRLREPLGDLVTNAALPHLVAEPDLAADYLQGGD